MAAELFRRVVLVCKLALGQRDVNLVVADLMQQHRRPMPPTSRFWNQMMQRLPRPLGNGAQAQWANRNLIRGHGHRGVTSAVSLSGGCFLHYLLGDTGATKLCALTWGVA